MKPRRRSRYRPFFFGVDSLVPSINRRGRALSLFVRNVRRERYLTIFICFGTHAKVVLIKLHQNCSIFFFAHNFRRKIFRKHHFHSEVFGLRGELERLRRQAAEAADELGRVRMLHTEDRRALERVQELVEETRDDLETSRRLCQSWREEADRRRVQADEATRSLRAARLRSAELARTIETLEARLTSGPSQ